MAWIFLILLPHVILSPRIAKGINKAGQIMSGPSALYRFQNKHNSTHFSGQLVAEKDRAFCGKFAVRVYYRDIRKKMVV